MEDLSYSVYNENILATTPPDPCTFAKRTKEIWDSDSSFPNCKNCKCLFRIYRRRHHCRNCAGVFCDTCSQYKCKIPPVIQKLPSRTGLQEKIDYTVDVRLCEKCYLSYQAISKLQTDFLIFSLLPLTIRDLKNIKTVCKEWKTIADFYLSKFREIQYKLPNQKYNKWEKQILWTNRFLLKNHIIWQNHLLLSLSNSLTTNLQNNKIKTTNLQNNKIKTINKHDISKQKRMDSILKIYRNGNKSVNKTVNKIKCECWNIMCCRLCVSELDAEKALQLLPISYNKNVSDYITSAFRTTTDSELENYWACILNYFQYLQNFVIEKCQHNVRFANITFWYLTNKDKQHLPVLIENLSKDMYLNILKSQIFAESVMSGKYNVSKNMETISVTNPELGLQTVFTEKISVKESATRPVYIPMTKHDLLYKHDSVGKDYVIMSVIRCMTEILKKSGIYIDVVTYNIQPVSETDGFIEIVKNCETLYNLSEKQNISITNYLLKHNPDKSVSQLRQTFKKSCAFYSVVSYLLSISDRNSENLMVTKNGDFFEIDYSYCLGGPEPKPIKPSCIRITYQMLDALGGENSDEYLEFKELCCTIYDVLRRHVNTFICLLSLIPQFTGTNTSPNLNENVMLQELAKRFSVGDDCETALKNLKTRIDDSANGSSTTKYHIIDFFHKINKEKTVNTYIDLGYTTSKNLLTSFYGYVSGS